MDKTKGKQNDSILFVKVENDGFDLGAQRRIIDKNDLQRGISVVFKEKIDTLNEKAKKRSLGFSAPDKSQCAIIKNDIYPDKRATDHPP